MVHPKMVDLFEALMDISGDHSFTLEFSRKGKEGKFVSIAIKDSISEIGDVVEKDMNSALIDMMDQIDSFVTGVDE